MFQGTVAIQPFSPGLNQIRFSWNFSHDAQLPDTFNRKKQTISGLKALEVNSAIVTIA
jgi:hypothetical protein